GNLATVGRFRPHPRPLSQRERGEMPFSSFFLGACVMPTFQYEAMDTTGGEVKDTIDATSEEEAQQKIRSLGYFVTRLTEVATKKKKDKKKGQPEKRKKTKVLTLGGVNSKQLVTFTRQFSVLQ